MAQVNQTKTETPTKARRFGTKYVREQVSKYTVEVQKVFKSHRPPFPGFIVDLVEFNDYLELRVYRDNVESFSEPQKVALAEYLYTVRDAIRSITNCHIRGVIDAPPSRKSRN